MSDFKILIVDDEPPARKKLRAFIEQEDSIGEILEADNGQAAVELIRASTPDLIFLDIQMPGMTGFEVIDTIGADKMPPVVFVTAFDQYAIKAFEVQALDYLLKPFDRERFQKTFRRAVESIKAKLDNAVLLDNLLKAIKQEKEYLYRIMVSVGSKYHFVKTEDIIFLSSEDKYVKIQCKNEDYLLRDTLTNLETQLDPENFVRIHRSSIVNMSFIKEIQPWSHGDNVVILQGGYKLNMSRRYRDRVFKN